MVGPIAVTFVATPDQVSFAPWQGSDEPVTDFWVDGIEIATDIKGRIGETFSGVHYACDGSFVKVAGKDVPNFYCKTNGSDRVSQFEYSAADGNGFGTGGGTALSWKKVYALRSDGKDVFVFVFVGLRQDLASYPPDPSDKVTAATASTKAYLDALLAKPENQSLIEQADAFVDALQIEATK